MSVVSNQKEELRNRFLDARTKLSDQAVREKSQSITEKLIKVKQFKEANVIHCYVSIKKNKEVDTRKFIKLCFQLGINVVAPKIMGEGLLKHYEINSLQELQENKLGVPEPMSGKEVSFDEIDLVVVPMVAGDRKKNRLGYGAGYYDRFLEKCTAPSIGILYTNQLYEGILPIEEFDIPLDILITESEQIL